MESLQVYNFALENIRSNNYSNLIVIKNIKHLQVSKHQPCCLRESYRKLLVSVPFQFFRTHFRIVKMRKHNFSVDCALFIDCLGM